LRAEVVTDLGKLAAFEDSWRNLAEQRGNAFITPEWFRSWFDAYADGHSPAVIVGRDDGGAVRGVLPMVRQLGRPHALRFGGFNLGDSFHAAAAIEDVDELAVAAAAALAEDPGRRLIVLDNLPAEDPLARVLATRADLAEVPQRRGNQPYAVLPGSWDEYLESRSAKRRKRLRYLERTLGREHQVEFRQVADPGELDPAFDELFRLHDLRWQERGGSSLAPGPAREAHRSFARAALARGWLRLRLLEVDGVAVAAFYGWRIGDRYAFYQGGFDPAWAKLSVGTLIVSMSLRSAIEEGAREFDMLLGGEEYKARFAERSREVRTVALAPALSPVRLALGGEALMRRMGRRITARGGRGARIGTALANRLPTGRGG
jgi:CelD/BcsL family acetyltransferase involved in cellulose biosynthesis